MLVKATKRGFYGARIIEEGQTFRISGQKAFSEIWMVKVGTAEAAAFDGGPRTVPLTTLGVGQTVEEDEPDPAPVDPVQAGPGPGGDEVRALILEAAKEVLASPADGDLTPKGMPKKDAVQRIIGGEVDQADFAAAQAEIRGLIGQQTAS